MLKPAGLMIMPVHYAATEPSDAHDVADPLKQDADVRHGPQSDLTLSGFEAGNARYTVKVADSFKKIWDQSVKAMAVVESEGRATASAALLYRGAGYRAVDGFNSEGDQTHLYVSDDALH